MNIKKKYIIFLDKIKAINLDGIQDSIIIKVLISVLNSTEYLNISESECVKIIIIELKKHYELDENVKDIIVIYENLILIPYEIQ